MKVTGRSGAPVKVSGRSEGHAVKVSGRSDGHAVKVSGGARRSLTEGQWEVRRSDS